MAAAGDAAWSRASSEASTIVAPAWMMLMTQLEKVPRSLPLRPPARHPPRLTAGHAAATSGGSSGAVQPVRQ